MSSRHLILMAVFATLAAVAPVASAQGCFGDDALNIPGSWCLPTTPNLPIFPAITLPSEFCCFKDCDVENVDPGQITLNSPITFFCDTYFISMTMNGAAVSTNTQFMIAKYSRTWLESTPLTSRQIWRFIVNIDVTFPVTAASSTPCPIPPCHGLGTAPLPVHFVGYLDYAQNCVTGVWEAALVMAHMCGNYTHQPYSARPLAGGAAHPERSYAIAAPTPFVWGASGNAPMGGIYGDSMRKSDLNLPGLSMVCRSEVPVSQGAVNTVFQDCPCVGPLPPIPVTPQWHHQDLFFTYACPGGPAFSFTPIAFGPTMPTGLAFMEVGKFAPALPFSYPGSEAVGVYVGLALSQDPCSTTSFPFHVVQGAGTVGGDSAATFDGVGFNGMIDLVNSKVLNTGSPTLLSIGLGKFFFSDFVWNLNVL